MLTTNIIYFTNQFISCFMNECWPGILCLFANVAVGFINKFLCFFVRHQNHNLHKCWFSFTDFFLKFYIHNISFFSNFLKKKCIIFSLKSRDFFMQRNSAQGPQNKIWWKNILFQIYAIFVKLWYMLWLTDLYISLSQNGLKIFFNPGWSLIVP